VLLERIKFEAIDSSRPVLLNREVAIVKFVAMIRKKCYRFTILTGTVKIIG